MATGVGDTIVALSSGAVPSGVAVIRLSGPRCRIVVTEIMGQLPVPRRLALSPIRLGEFVLDTGLIAWMPAPNSFTGEDCAELQVHGSPAVVRSILRILAARDGIRLADAGEFTRRAFENGKLDLAEAQGLGDLIEAETENQRAIAYARMEGGLTRQIEDWRERLLDLRASLEAQLDFSDEGDVGALPAQFMSDVGLLTRDINAVLATRGQGRILRSGFRVVLAGPPNAGKSSLLNALSKSDVAIVSDEAGTTRDIKEVPLDIRGQMVILVDSAGLRETTSKAEAIGVDRARQAMLAADLVLWLMAPEQPEEPMLEFVEAGDEQLRRPPVLKVGTKSDIGAVASADVSVSVSSNVGVDALLDLLYHTSGASAVRPGDILVSHEQDRISLFDAQFELSKVLDIIDETELAAEHLRRAGVALERLLGRIDAEHVLDRLFSRFCIGK